jgi:hypothetical protein
MRRAHRSRSANSYRARCRGRAHLGVTNSRLARRKRKLNLDYVTGFKYKQISSTVVLKARAGYRAGHFLCLG